MAFPLVENTQNKDRCRAWKPISGQNVAKGVKKRNAMRVSGFSVAVRHALLDGALYIAFVESGALVYCASPFFRNLAFVSAIRVTLCNCYFLVSECCVTPFGNISVV